MDNVIAQVYVIESKDDGVKPVIYLNRPRTIHPHESVLTFANPFSARYFIQMGFSGPIAVHKHRKTKLVAMRIG